MNTTNAATLRAAYATLRGTIKVFHYARRAMLRQLLLDLAPALQGEQTAEVHSKGMGG